MKFIKKLIKNKKFKEYIKIILFENIFFKKAIKNKKSYIVGYPLQRCIGKTTLIQKIARKNNLVVLTKYHIYSKNETIKVTSSDQIKIIRQKFRRGTIFLVDELDYKTLSILAMYGYILIGYSN